MGEVDMGTWYIRIGSFLLVLDLVLARHGNRSCHSLLGKGTSIR